MSPDIHSEVHQHPYVASELRLSYTRKAFRLLPRMERPRLLDMGCGRGEPTLELARLSGGEVTGLDRSGECLDYLERRAAEGELAERIHLIHSTMESADFKPQSFEIIWSEGSLHIAGFENGLRKWRPWLTPGGYLVVHEMCWLRPDPPAEIAAYWRSVYPEIRTPDEYVAAVPSLGYSPVASFPLPDRFWWSEYYEPLEKRIQQLRRDYRDDSESCRKLDREQSPIDLYKKHSAWYGSVFLLMQKTV